MILSGNLRCLSLLAFVFGQLNIHHVTATWPSSNTSNIELLGLFPFANITNATADDSVQSRAMFIAAVLLSQQYNITINGEFIVWQTVPTDNNALNALSGACQAVSGSNTVGIVGPASSQVAEYIAPFGERIGIPVVSYSATGSDLSDRRAYPNFFRTVPSDNAAASALVKLFFRFNWTSCVIIYQNDAYGTSGASIINEAFINNGLTVAETIPFNIGTQTIQGNLNTLLFNSASRIVILWAQSIYTDNVLELAFDADVLGPQFTWILSSSIPLDSFNQTYYQKFIGMLTIEPVVGNAVNVATNTTLLNAAYQLWQQYENETFPGSGNVSNYALFAFDATWLLIQSLQQLCLATTNSSSSCFSYTGPSYCFDRRFVYSDLFIKMIINTQFLGVSGPIAFNENVTDRINSSYYYAQNIQLSSTGLNFVPVLDYADPYGWNSYSGGSIITWPGNSSVQPTGRPSLKGITLRIGVIVSPPFLMVQNVTDASGQSQVQLSGYMFDLIALLENNTGFNATIQVAPLNQTYNEVVQAVANGIYDIVVADVTITSQRRTIVDFSNSIFDNSLRIIMQSTPGVQLDLLAFLAPFSRNLWVVSLCACIAAGIVFCAMERHDNEDLKDRSLISQLAMSMWFAFGNIIGFGAQFDVTTGPGRLLTSGLYMLSIVLVASFTANLASSLTIQNSQGVITGIDSIQNGEIPYNRIGIVVGTSYEDYYLNEISNNNPNFYPLYSNEQIYTKLVDGIILASFVDIGTGEYQTNNVYCNLTLVGSGFDYGAYGIVTPKEWIYAQDLDVHILSLRELNALDALAKKWISVQVCPTTATSSSSMSIEQLAGLFLVFGVVMCLSLLFFAWIKRRLIKQFFCQLLYQKKDSSEGDDSARNDSTNASERL